MSGRNQYLFLLKLNSEYEIFLSKASNVIDTTQVPCTYQHFSLVGEPTPMNLLPSNQFMLYFVTTDIMEEEEVLFFFSSTFDNFFLTRSWYFPSTLWSASLEAPLASSWESPSWASSPHLLISSRLFLNDSLSLVLTRKNIVSWNSIIMFFFSTPSIRAIFPSQHKTATCHRHSQGNGT